MRFTLSAFLLLSSWPAQAHQSIDFTVRGPAGVQYSVSSTYAGTEYPNTLTGTIPASGEVSTTVFGYVPHDDGDTLRATFTDGIGTVACAPEFVSIYEPLWHYTQACSPLFVFDGASRTCASSCPDAPALRHGGAPRVYPNPIRSSQVDAMKFISFPPNARVRIFSLTGRLVWEGRTDELGGMHWHLVDRNNKLVGSGVYQVVADGPNGHAALKIAVQR